MKGWLVCLLFAAANVAAQQLRPRALLPPPVAPGIETPRRQSTGADDRIARTNTGPRLDTNLQARVKAERERLNRNALQFQIDRAAEGSAVAMRSLGQRYMTGDLVEKDEEKAREWLKKAADAGDNSAVVLLERLDKARLNSVRTNLPPERISDKK